MARGDDARLTFAFRTAPHPYRPTTAQQVQKNGTGEHIPPPRPKRKSAQPYPQKSSAGGRGAEARKKPHAGAGAGAGGGGSNVMGPGGGMAGGGMSAGAGLANGLGPLGNQGRLNRGVPLEFGAPVPGGGYLVHARGGDARWGPSPGLQAGGMAHGGNPSGYPATGGGSLSFGGGSFGGSLGADPRGAGLSGPDGSDAMRAHASPLRKHPTSNPDFVVVYTFLAGLFDPNQRGHADKLRQMRAIDRETASLLMRNLGANLMCQRMWEDQIQLIGQGHPTFVNATYDERGGLTGVAGGHAMQASAAAGDGASGDGTSGDGSGDGADGALPDRRGSAGSGGSDEEGGVGGAGEGNVRGDGEAAAANEAGGPEAGSRDGSPVESPGEEGTKMDGGDTEAGSGGGGGGGGDGGGGVEPGSTLAAPPGDAAPLSAFLA